MSFITKFINLKKPKKGKKKLEETFSRKKYFGQINRHFVALNFYFKINNKAFENYLNKKKKKSLKDEWKENQEFQIQINLISWFSQWVAKRGKYLKMTKSNQIRLEKKLNNKLNKRRNILSSIQNEQNEKEEDENP